MVRRVAAVSASLSTQRPDHRTSTGSPRPRSRSAGRRTQKRLEVRDERASAARRGRGRTPSSGDDVRVRRHPEADVAGAAVRRVRAARGTAITPAVGLVAEIGAPAHVPLTGAGGIEPVRTPLPDVAGDVVEPVAVRGNAPTGAVPAYPSAPVLSPGNSPWNTFMRCPPPGSNSSPHGKRDSDPRVRRTPTRPLSAGGSRSTRRKRGVAPRDVGHRMVMVVRCRNARPVGVSPVGAVSPDATTGRWRRRVCRGEVVGQEAAEHERPARRAPQW